MGTYLFEVCPHLTTMATRGLSLFDQRDEERTMSDMNFTPEQRRLIASCKTTEDLLSLIKEGSIELSDLQLERIVGGVAQNSPVDFTSLIGQ